MRIETSTVIKYTLRDLDRLDPVGVLLEDYGQGQGKLIVECYGRAWAAYWGAMGGMSLVNFLLSCDKWYLAGKLSSISSKIIDYDEISRQIGNTVELETLASYHDEMMQVYGGDWHMCLPERSNPEYEYLCRIIDVVLEALLIKKGEEELRWKGHIKG